MGFKEIVDLHKTRLVHVLLCDHILRLVPIPFPYNVLNLNCMVVDLGLTWASGFQDHKEYKE